MERWKIIKENPEYMISDSGAVKRVSSGRINSIRDKKGYLVTDLYRDGKRKTVRVHRLVAEEYLPNPDNKPEVNHIDGNKHNNFYSNLEWVSKKENCRHAWENSLARPSYGMLGKKNPNAGRKGRPFRIVETGEIFQTLQDCESAIGGNGRHINDCLRGRQSTHRGYHFEYM